VIRRAFRGAVPAAWQDESVPAPCAGGPRRAGGQMRVGLHALGIGVGARPEVIRAVAVERSLWHRAATSPRRYDLRHGDGRSPRRASRGCRGGVRRGRFPHCRLRPGPLGGDPAGLRHAYELVAARARLRKRSLRFRHLPIAVEGPRPCTALGTRRAVAVEGRRLRGSGTADGPGQRALMQRLGTVARSSYGRC
jgi:hypothetical protein